jgi:hypothetical protein
VKQQYGEIQMLKVGMPSLPQHRFNPITVQNIEEFSGCTFVATLMLDELVLDNKTLAL